MGDHDHTWVSPYAESLWIEREGHWVVLDHQRCACGARRTVKSIVVPTDDAILAG